MTTLKIIEDLYDAENNVLKKTAEIETLKKQIQWIWENCRITFYPNGTDPTHGACPIEHNITNGCNKNSRSEIEKFMNNQRK